MNRRSFLSAILKAGVAAAILPSAVTYARKWKISKESTLLIPIKYGVDVGSFGYITSPYWGPVAKAIYDIHRKEQIEKLSEYIVYRENVIDESIKHQFQQTAEDALRLVERGDRVFVLNKEGCVATS